MKTKLKVAFVNPPHADWCLPQIVTFLSMQSHYDRLGKYPDRVEWLTPPYKWSTYTSLDQVLEEIIDADVVLFSSYVWNAGMLDEIATLVKQTRPEVITVIGGPHIGFDKPGFKTDRWMYDYISKPTTPGEVFMEDFLNLFIETEEWPNAENISYEARSDQMRKWEFLEFSLYREHFTLLRDMCSYADTHNLEKFIVLETTRGCPYKCAYCEWGGGIGTKVIKKSMEIVKQDIQAIRDAGYVDVYSTDANFGIFESRDREILLFASKTGIKLTDISVVKAKNLSRRKRIVDTFYDAGLNWDLHIPIQSISDTAMKVANRVDMSLADKIELGKYIKQMADDHGYTRPGVEMIMGMPGSTISDFYAEYELLMDFDALDDHRHVYMVLPDSEASNDEYVSQHGLVLVDVYSDNVDEDAIVNRGSLFKNRRSYFKTIVQSFSFTRDQMCEMFFMNYAAPILIPKYYSEFADTHIAIFASACFEAISNMTQFQPMWAEINDLYDPGTPPRNIAVLLGQQREVVIADFIGTYSSMIYGALHEILHP